MWWKCGKCKKKLEEEITFSSQFCYYVKKFLMFPDLSLWAKLWSLYLITLWWKCDENVMNCIWYSFFGSYHLKIPASQKTSCSFTMTMNNEPSILSYSGTCTWAWARLREREFCDWRVRPERGWFRRHCWKRITSPLTCRPP